MQQLPPSTPGVWLELRRYAKVLRLFWVNTAAVELEYRLNFFFTSITSLGHVAASIFGLFLFTRTGYQFEGWSWEEALLVLGMMTFLEGVTEALLAPNLGRIVQYVQRGTLDFILLKPMDAQFWVSTRTLSPGGLTHLVTGLGLLVYSGWHLDLPLSAWILGIYPLGLALVTLYSLWFVLAATSIWFVKVYNAVEVLKGLLEAGRYPITAFPPVFRLFFTFVVPVAFLSTVPAEVVLGRVGLEYMALATLLAVGTFVASRAFWKFALRHYTSASS